MKNSKTAIALGASAVAFGWHFHWASNFWSTVVVGVRFAAPYLLAVLAAGALALSGVAVKTAREKIEDRKQKGETTAPRYGGYGRPWQLPETIVAGMSVVAVIGIIVGMIFLPYETDAEYRTGAVSFTGEPTPDFEPRYPYLVADGLMPRSVGDAENVRVSQATYTDPSQGQWAGIVSGVGSLRPSLGVVVKDGERFVRCDWPSTTGGGFDVAFGATDTVGALEGRFGNRLTRQLRQVQRYTLPQWDGMGAWCDEQGPWVLIPATKPAGIIRVHTVPAGAWVIDPAGEITWHEQIEPGQYPVPVIDPDLARRMVDANKRIARTGELAGWRSVLLQSAKVGLERPEGADSYWEEEGNPDWGNAGEFLLRTVEGRWVYATPLTPVGASETVVAIAVVPADEMVVGQLPKVTVHRLGEDLQRRSNLELAKVLRTDFDADVQWEAGYEIFELAPLSGGTWSATIGQSLEVKYRAVIQPDGDACLHLFDTMQLVRCSGDSRPAPDATGDEEVTLSLENMSEEELLRLLEEIARELRNR